MPHTPDQPRGPQPATPAPQGAAESMISTGMGMLAGSMVNEGTLSPAQGQMVQQTGQGIADRLQYRWWTQEAQNFTAEQGKTYQQAMQSIQKTMDTEYKAGMTIKDIPTQQQTVNAAFQKALMSTQNAEISFLDSMSEFPNNPIIADMGKRLFEARHGSMQELMKGQEQGAEMQEAQATAQTAGTTAQYAPQQQEATLRTKAAQAGQAETGSAVNMAKLATMGQEPMGTAGYFFNNVEKTDIADRGSFDDLIARDSGARAAVDTEVIGVARSLTGDIMNQIEDIKSIEDPKEKQRRTQQFRTDFGVDVDEYNDIYSKEGGHDNARAYVARKVYDMVEDQAKRNVLSRARRGRGMKSQGKTTPQINEDNAAAATIDPDIYESHTGNRAPLESDDPKSYDPSSPEGQRYEGIHDAYSEAIAERDRLQEKLDILNEQMPGLLLDLTVREPKSAQLGLGGAGKSGNLPTPIVDKLAQEDPEALQKIRDMLKRIDMLDKEARRLKDIETKAHGKAVRTYQLSN